MATRLQTEAAALGIINETRAFHGLDPIDWDFPALSSRHREVALRQGQAAVDAALRAEWPLLERHAADRPFTDRRHWRATRLTHEIMNTLRRYIAEHRERDLLRDAHRDLFDLLFTKGAEVITDEDRREAGLPPRNEYGMTRQELAALEAQRFEVVLRPIPPLFVPTARTDDR